MKRSKRMLALALAFVLTFLQMSEIAIAAEPKVTEITAASNTIGASGGSIALQVSGSGLTSDNWGIDAVAYIAGLDIERPALKPTIKDITANSATLVIPQNTMKNDIEYHVSAGVITAGKVQKEAEIIIVQAGKTYDTVEIIIIIIKMKITVMIIQSVLMDRSVLITNAVTDRSVSMDQDVMVKEMIIEMTTEMTIETITEMTDRETTDVHLIVREENQVRDSRADVIIITEADLVETETQAEMPALCQKAQ